MKRIFRETLLLIVLGVIGSLVLLGGVYIFNAICFLTKVFKETFNEYSSTVFFSVLLMVYALKKAFEKDATEKD